MAIAEIFCPLYHALGRGLSWRIAPTFDCMQDSAIKHAFRLRFDDRRIFDSAIGRHRVFDNCIALDTATLGATRIFRSCYARTFALLSERRSG